PGTGRPAAAPGAPGGATPRRGAPPRARPRRAGAGAGGGPGAAAPPRHDAAVELAHLLDGLDLQAGHGEPLGERRGRAAPGDELGEPGERDAHGRGCSERELPEEAEIVVVEEPEVGEAVAQEGQPIG